MDIKCAHTELVDLDLLTPNPRNPNKHPENQIQLLAKIMKHQGWRSPVIVSNRSGFIVKGHGRLMAAKLNGWEQVPVDRQDYETEADEYADMVADNKIAELSETDLDMVAEDVLGLPSDFDLDLLGIPDFESLDPESGSGEASESDIDLYTKKIQTPVYEPKGEKPPLSALFDTVKTRELIAEIEASEIPDDVKDFCKLAAHRHTVFNYENIAEYYSHAPAEVQDLMERSALVIIDFKKAIEHGFVVLSQEIAEAYADAAE